MCGLVGVSGSIFKKELETFHDALLISTVRGPHSTGVGIIKRGGKEYYVDKKVGGPLELFDSKLYNKHIEIQDKSVLLGHNRWATVGSVNKANAHPFECEGLIGTHNGTLSFMSRQAIDKGNEYGTDSEALFNSIDKHGVEHTMGLVEGAWALVWYDFEEDSLNFLRNKERTLYYTFSKDRKVMFWGSEHILLLAALHRNGVEHGDIYLFPEDTFFSWEVPALNEKFSDRPFERKKVKGKPPYVPRIIYSSPEKKKEGPTVFPKTGGKDGKKPTESLGTTNVNKASSAAFYRGFKGEKLLKEQFEKATSSGCCWCGDSIEWGETVRFISADSALCGTCLSKDETLTEISQYVDISRINSQIQQET